MSESANSAKSAKQIFANFVKFVRPICGTTRRSEGRVTEAEYPTNYQRISNLLLTIRPFRVAILAVLLVFVGGWNTQAWGVGKAKLKLYSSPSTGGYVYANTSNSNNIGTLTEDDATTGTSTKPQTLYRFASAKSGYVFKGWGGESENSGSTSSSVSVDVGSWGGTNTDIYYAIFARLTAQSTATLAFGTKLIGNEWNTGTTKSVTIDYVHAGNITATITGTNKTEFSLSSTSSSQSKTVVSNNTNSETNSTITVYFKPSSEGNKSATLTISSSNGLDNITIGLTGTGQATVNPEYTCNIENWYYVDDASIDLNSLWTSTSPATKTYSIKADSWTPAGTNNSGATVPAITNNRLSLGQAGTLTLKLTQASYTGYYSGSDEKTIEIRKRPNTIYVKGSTSYSNSIYVDSYDNGLTLTADNTDYSNCPISNNQTAGQDIATFYQNDEVVYSSYKLGTATWTLSQPENYKYQAGNGSFTVNVIQQSAEDCYLLNEPSQQTSSHTYNLNGRGKILYIDFRRSWGDVASKIKIIGISSNGEEEIDSPSWDDNWTRNKSYDISSKDYTQIKVELSGGVNTKYYENLKVTRQTWLNIATDSGNNGTLTINKKSDNSPINPGQTGVANSKIYWSCVDGGDLKIVCENPHFSFSQNTITNTACNNGTTDITVSYTNTEPGTETATVTVYNKMYRQTFTVKGVIEKADQLIAWHNDILRLGQSYTDVATANTLVTYESADESIIRVDEDGEGHKTILTAVGTGTVNITATAEESSFYAEKSSTKGIKVTEKQIQWIDWNQSLFGLKLGGANVTMNAVAASDVEDCVSSRLIEYSSNNESVVKVVNNNQLQIIGVGTAIITAVQAGGFDTDGHDYERAETEKTVIVRDPNAPCESFAYQQGQEVKMDCGWNASDKKTRISEINFNDIIPATGTLRYKGENRKVAINYFDGTMSVEQYIPGEDWKPVTGGDLGKPSIGTYETANLTFDRRATKMRVKVTDGLGYHYFTDCQVTQARFIETTAPVDFNLNVGQQQNQVIYLSYSNITDGLSLTLAQGANSHFSVDKSFIEGSCGSAAKNVALTITYHPTAEETNVQDVLTITDGTTTCQVVLTGSATRVNRHIIWDHADETNIYTVQTETLSAEARTDLNELAGTVAFSLAGSSTAAGSVSAENVLSFTSAGVADVVAYTKDDPRYNVAPNVVKTFNVAITPTQIQVAPTVNAITSGDLANINEVVLNGGKAVNTINGAEVEGTFAVTSGDVINAGTNTLQLTFTPSNTDMYSGCTGTTTIVVNKAVSNIFTNASGNGKWNEPKNWSNGVPTGDEPDVIISGDLIIDEELTVGNLTIKKNSRVVLTVNGNLTVNGASEDLTEYGDLHVREGGQVNLSNGTLKVHNFTLDAALSGTKGGVHQNAASGQVANPTKLDVRGDAYFVLTIDPADALTYGWYDFTVPFEVEISNGIYRYGENTPMRSGVDFMIMEYSESRRASGMKGWVNASGTLQPGRAYTITLDKWAYTTYVFKKKTGASTTGTNSFNAVASDVESQTRGWNGLGNGSLSHAQLTDAFSNAKVQLYDHAHNVYVTKEANESNFAVGTAFFIQVSEAQTISFAAAEENRTMMAPSREVYTMDEFRLTLKDTETDNTTDRLWLSASEEATEEYVIGQDLLKMGTPTSGTVAQMWTMKGGKVLCDVETAMNGERATAPLSFYAPKAGQYELAIDQAPEDVTLYLTYNDQVIWVLSFGSYVFDLEKGTTEGYGLRMETNRAPQIATGIDEQTAGAQNRKVMINNTLYIVTAEGAIFDVMGKNIK